MRILTFSMDGWLRLRHNYFRDHHFGSTLRTPQHCGSSGNRGTAVLGCVLAEVTLIFQAQPCTSWYIHQVKSPAGSVDGKSATEVFIRRMIESFHAATSEPLRVRANVTQLFAVRSMQLGQCVE